MLMILFLHKGEDIQYVKLSTNKIRIKHSFKKIKIKNIIYLQILLQQKSQAQQNMKQNNKIKIRERETY